MSEDEDRMSARKETRKSDMGRVIAVVLGRFSVK